jgi:hypothetical protein
MFAAKCPGGWMHFHELKAICDKCKLLTAPGVFSGTVTEMFKHFGDPKNIYNRQTAFPALLGLPDIKDNWAEGVVMKLWAPDARPKRKQLTTYGLTFKWKTQRHREKGKKASKVKSDGDGKSSDGKDKALLTSQVLTAIGYINRARVAAYFSKLSQTEQEAATKNLGVHIQGVRQDAMDEFFKDLNDASVSLKTAGKQLIGKMSSKAKEEILAYLAS